MSSSSSSSFSSSSSSPSSSTSSSSNSSPSSSSSGCAGLCFWEFDALGQPYPTCIGCDPTTECKAPIPLVREVGLLRGDVTRCLPIDGFPPSSSSGAFALEAALRAPLAEARVRVPKMSDLRVWRSFPFPVNKPWQYLALPEMGWHVTFLRVPAGPPSPVITPAVLPTDVEERADRAVAASVILPETGGHRQYWIPVLEKHRWAQLQTAEWTVVFLRLPLPLEQ